MIRRGFLLLASSLLISALAQAEITGIITRPGGNNGDIQVNDNGRFGGVSPSSFSISGSSSSLTLGGTTYNLQINGGSVLIGTRTLTMNTTANLLTIGANTLFSNVTTTQWTNFSSMTFESGTTMAFSSSSVLKLPASSTPNPPCTSNTQRGQIYIDTNAPSGQQIYGCEGASGWILQGGTGGGSDVYNATGTAGFPYGFSASTGVFTSGVTASSFTASGSGVGVLTLKDSDGSNFVSLEASGTIVSDMAYVLPSSSGTVGQVLSINGRDGNGKISTKWAAAADPNAAVLTATQTFSGTNTFAQSTNFTGVSTTSFNNVSSVTFNNTWIIIPAGSTVSASVPILANGSYGTTGQVLSSNGQGSPVSWVDQTGGGGGGGGSGGVNSGTIGQMTYYAVNGTTVSGTSNLINNTSSITVSVETNFQSVSSMTFTNSALVVLAGSTLAVNGSLQANNSYGTSGQVLQSNGSGSAPSWTTITGGGGSGGVNSGTVGQMAYYAVAGTTVSGTSNLINNTSSITVNAATFVGSSLTVTQSITGNYLNANSSATVIGVTRGVGGFISPASFVSGTGNDTGSLGTGTLQLAASGGSIPIQITDAQNRSSARATYNAMLFKYNPLSESSAFSGGAVFGQLNSSNTITPANSYAIIGSGQSNFDTGATTYFRVNVSTLGSQVGDVEVLMGGMPQLVGGTQYTITASSTASNTTAETMMVRSPSIPPDFWKVGRNIKVKASGVYGTTTTAGNFSFKLNIGTTTVLSTTTFALTGSQINQVWMFGVFLTCRATGSSGSLIGNTALGMYDTSNKFQGFPMVNTAAQSVDLSIARDVRLLITFSSADSNNTFTVSNFVAGTE